jgi:predicted protein tyrosine phosphatase
MENKHAKLVKEFSKNKHGGNLVVLSIEDKYMNYQKELIELLVTKTSKYF